MSGLKEVRAGRVYSAKVTGERESRQGRRRAPCAKATQRRGGGAGRGSEVAPDIDNAVIHLTAIGRTRSYELALQSGR